MEPFLATIGTATLVLVGCTGVVTIFELARVGFKAMRVKDPDQTVHHFLKDLYR